MAARVRTKPFAENLGAIRAEAAALLDLQHAAVPMEWTDWELDFLESMAERQDDEPLTVPQVEKFAQLRRLATLQSKVEGLSVALLVANCTLEADYLDDEDDRAFVRALRQKGTAELRRRQLGRLLRCCRELGVIEPHHGWAE